MHLLEIDIKNIKSTAAFHMNFHENPAGWHVLIGDNGAGKTSIIRAIALLMIGPDEASALRQVFVEWVKKDSTEATIWGKIQIHENDGYAGKKALRKRPFDAYITIQKEQIDSEEAKLVRSPNVEAADYIWSGKRGWFSASFGPFRRFSGGNDAWSKVYYANPRAAAHLSAFGEDVALTESLEWLSKLKFASLENDPKATQILSSLQHLLNEGDLLPQGVKLSGITSKGVTFKDGNNTEIDIKQMSDGFRSLLSLIFELIWQLTRCYGEQAVFENINKGIFNIPLPGVVIIDEIDAHLHPTWQTRVGQWFTKYFPDIQFIVTTHSPLVCRGCTDDEGNSKGTIWRLATPGSDQVSGEITGDEKQRLTIGNVLDAYATEAFGANTSQSKAGIKMGEEIAALSLKSFKGIITDDEKKRLSTLKSQLPTAAAL